MQYTVVHSKDPYLLARLATDLQMGGYNHRESILFSDPFGASALNLTNERENTNMPYMAINEDNREDLLNQFSFYYVTAGDPIRHELTSRNYIKVLTQILEP